MTDERHALLGTTFRELHQSGCFLLANVADAGTAAALSAAGVDAIATSSAAHAQTIGRADASGDVSMEEHADHTALVAAAAEVPLNVDAENGYGHEPEDMVAAVQRFAAPADLDLQDCTIEEREEYEPYVRQGLVIFAGVDYAAILQAAEAEADIILWDGGNNDFSFVRADLNIVVCDALRAGHGLDYYPGETNFRAADIVVINKTGQASAADIDSIRRLKDTINPEADLVTADLEVSVEAPESIRGKRVLIVEDGPTVTHGGMGYGAGWVAAHRYGAGEVVDPRSSAVGSLVDIYQTYPQLLAVLPAMGYSQQQRQELKASIESSGAELVLKASPANVGSVLELTLPVVQVRYRFVPLGGVDILARVRELKKGGQTTVSKK